MDLLRLIQKYSWGGGQDSNLKPYDQVVKVGEGWVDLEPVILTICWVAKWVNILLDTRLDVLFDKHASLFDKKALRNCSEFPKKQCRDIEHDGIQNNDTQHNNAKCDKE